MDVQLRMHKSGIEGFGGLLTLLYNAVDGFRVGAFRITAQVLSHQ